jgi:hypothetical protein
MHWQSNPRASVRLLEEEDDDDEENWRKELKDRRRRESEMQTTGGGRVYLGARGSQVEANGGYVGKQERRAGSGGSRWRDNV